MLTGNKVLYVLNITSYRMTVLLNGPTRGYKVLVQSKRGTSMRISQNIHSNRFIYFQYIFIRKYSPNFAKIFNNTFKNTKQSGKSENFYPLFG